VKLVGKVPVEPLDDERLVHIERRVVANAEVASPVRGGWLRHVVPLAISAAAIAIAIVVGWSLHGAALDGGQVADHTPGLAPATGDAPVRVHTDAPASTSPSGLAPLATAPLATAPLATIDIGDATIASSAGTDVAITRPDGGVLVQMAHGQVELQVAKRHGRPPLVVRAGDTDVVVVGTHFTVAWDGHGPVDVRVTEGVVRCLHAGSPEARVAAGQAWRSDAGMVALADPPIEIDTHVTKDLLHDRTAAVPDVPATASRGVDGSAGAATSKPTLDDPKDPHHDLKADIRAQALQPAMDVGAADPAAAIAAYRDIWKIKFDDQAERALYSTALLQAQRDRLGDPLTSLDLYIRRFATKHDDVTTAAFWLRVRIECLRAFDDRCRAAATAYVQHAGDGPAAHVAELITLTE
jgi:hypothetical protein